MLGPDDKQLKGADGKPQFKEVEVPGRIKYAIPSADFEDQQYWLSGNFYYDINMKTKWYFCCPHCRQKYFLE